MYSESCYMNKCISFLYFHWVQILPQVSYLYPNHFKDLFRGINLNMTSCQILETEWAELAEYKWESNLTCFNQIPPCSIPCDSRPCINYNKFYRCLLLLFLTPKVKFILRYVRVWNNTLSWHILCYLKTSLRRI